MDGDGYGDGANEFAGGGFMPPSTPQQGISGAGTTFSPSAGGRRSGASVLFPFTVRHFMECYESSGGDALAVNGSEVNNVVLVGKVMNLDSRTTDLQFSLDDGTGKIEIRKWHDDQEHEREALAAIKTGGIVKVHGVPRRMGAKHTLSANSIRAIDDFNEYTCHFLDCIFAYQYSKGQGAKVAGSTPPGARPAGGAAPQGMPHSGPSAYQGAQVPSQAAGVAGGSGNPRGVSGDGRFVQPPSGLQLHERVLKFFADNEGGPNDNQGLHRDTVARNISNASPQQVIDAIDFLVSEGHLYSTIDELHFKTLGDGGN